MATIITLSFGLFGQPAQAAGETYTWKDAANLTITASGGAYSSAATLTKSSLLPNGGAEFTGTASLTCTTGSVTASIKLDVDGDNYTKIFPSLASLIAPASAVCAKLDTTVAVSRADGVTTTQTDAAAAATGQASTASTCNQGGLTFLFCPVIDNVSNTINNLVKSALVPLLEVKPISPETTPELHQVWTHVRDLTEILFIFVFLVIIYATVAEQDFGTFNKYAVKRMLPRLVAAAVLVQFSFGISSLLVDIGNVLGGGIETFVLSTLNPTAAVPTLTNALGNMITGSLAVLVGAGAIAILATWTIALPLLVSLLISIFVVFLTLGARYLLIAILIVISPLAILAWVMPNTESYFTQWRKLFFSLVLMYPIIVGVLSIASIVSEILPFTASTTASAPAAVAVAIIQPLIAIAAFLMVPVTFRWASKGLGKVTGMISTTGTKSQGMLKGSDFWQRGINGRKANQADYMNRFVKSDAIKSLGNGGAVSRGAGKVATFAAGTAFLNAPKTARGAEKLRSGIIASTVKDLGDLQEASVTNMQKVGTAFYDSDEKKRIKARRELQADAPNLMSIASNPVGRVAIQKRLAEMGFSTDNTTGSLTAPKRNRLGVNGNMALEFPELLTAGGKEFGSKPSIMARINKPVSDYQVKDIAGNVVETISRDAGDLDPNTFRGFVRGIKPKTFGDKHHADNFKVMGRRSDKPADELTEQEILQDRVAREVAASYAEEMESKIIEKAFNPKSASVSNLAVRLEWIKDSQKNKDIFDKSKNGVRVYEAAVDNLLDDERLAENMAIMAGTDRYKIKNLSSLAIAAIAYNWYMGNKSYDPYDIHEDDGATYLRAHPPKGRSRLEPDEEEDDDDDDDDKK